MTDKVIEVKNLSKTFFVKDKEAGLLGSFKSFFSNKRRKIEAVNSIDFDINAGEMIGFIGPNGAGKTTTLKMLSGILYPTDGQIEVLGYKPFERKHDFLKKISLVMGQKNQLLWDLPAIDTFNLNKEVYEISKKEYQETLEELIEIFEIKDILNQQVRKLSLGQRMKCELVASILHNPKILFLDEPTIGLDILIQKKLRKFIKEYNKKFGTTVILTSHYMDDVKEIAERIIIINEGSLVFDNSISELSHKFANYKLLSLTLNTDANEGELKQLGDINYNFPKLEIKVTPSKTAEVTSQVLKLLDVDDIDISDPKLEDIVAKIFETKR
ncbi:ATP-binding cassette domain-containing protein [Candidatus Dojkabacteria bacterium]|nr:ATP-binding cassette domain-containing protein [Candidatus Dojkabacteria bacterium]